MSYNADYTREYFAIMESLQGDVPGRRAAYEYLQGSTAIVHHQVVAASFVPRLFDAGTYRIMKETAETAHRILVKVIEHYLADPDYRRAFDFDPRLEELICLLMGVGDALVTFVNMEQMMFFYRLYYADWYLALYMLVNGLVYSSIGAWLGAKTGSKLQQVMGE